jgi:hypothetical protein
VGGLIDLPLWENVTNYLHGVKYVTTCIPHHFPNSIFGNFEQISSHSLCDSAYFHHFPYVYLIHKVAM